MQPEGNNGVDGDKEKDDGRGKSVKVYRIIHLYLNHSTKYQNS